MKVKLKTILAGPHGSGQPGDILDLPNGADLVSAGYAEAVEAVKKPEVAVKPEQEEVKPKPKTSKKPEQE